MQQFTVPQFIDVEDKIIGPITARQFIIMLSGFMVMVILYRVLDFSAFLFFSLLIFAVTGVFAFFKVNGMAFHFFVLNLLQTYSKPFLRVWNNDYQKISSSVEPKAINREEFEDVEVKRIGSSHLAKLALIVDTQGSYKGKDVEKVKELKN